MPKRLKKPARPKRPSDPNQWAHELVRESTEERAPETPAVDFKTQLSTYMSGLGRKGGQESGRRRMENLSEQDRRDIASRAARARWEAVAKRKTAKKR